MRGEGYLSLYNINKLINHKSNLKNGLPTLDNYWLHRIISINLK